MPLIPIEEHKVCNPVLEELVAVVIDGLTLFSADKIRRDLLLNNRLCIRESLFIKQTDKPQERLCLSVMRRSRKKQ